MRKNKVELKNKDDWVKINAGQHTLMRVLYTPQMNKRLVQGVRDRSLGPEVSGLVACCVFSLPSS